jgi:predicted nucleic-acid-binding Zn-ribbon protein
MKKFQQCPKCGKKGLRYADHPHAQGWKDYNRAVCRFCGATFRVKEGESEEKKALDAHAQE